MRMVLNGQSSQSIALAVQALQRGELIGLPTETVYGLAADACNAQAVAKIFGIKEDVTSPTYVIMKSYLISPSKLSTFNFQLLNFIHTDAYRLDSAKELLSLEWERIMSDPRNIIFIEWPERVVDVLPKNHAKINFKFISENEREIEI